MKKHSPGCTCCKPKLFTNPVSYGQVLTPASHPGGSVQGIGRGWGFHSGSDPLIGDHVGGLHDDYDFPYWAKVFGGRENHVGRPGGLSQFIENAFSWFRVPTFGEPLGIFRDRNTGHFLLQSLSLARHDRSAPVLDWNGNILSMPRWQWGAVWYDLTLNQFVGEGLRGEGPAEIPITIWPEAAYVGPQEGGAIRFGDSPTIVLHPPEATPTIGGREVSNYEVFMFAPARAELAEHGRLRFAESTVSSQYFETPEGEMFAPAEQELLVEYSAWRWTQEANNQYEYTLTPEERYGYTPRDLYAGEMTAYFQSMERSQPHGVVKMEDGKVVEQYLIDGAVSPAIQTRQEAPQAGGPAGSVFNAPPLARGNAIWAANGDECRHLVYAYRYTADFSVAVVTGESEGTLLDYADVPYPNPQDIKPVERMYTEDILGVTRVKVPSVFPYAIEAPLVDEVHDALEWRDHCAAVFVCNNDKVMGPVPVYSGQKNYRRFVDESRFEFDGETYPRPVAAQPQGVLVYSTAKEDWFFIARLTDYLVLPYDAYYLQTESLRDKIPIEDDDRYGFSGMHESPVIFDDMFGDGAPQHPYLVFDGQMNEVARFVVDAYTEVERQVDWGFPFSQGWGITPTDSAYHAAENAEDKEVTEAGSMFFPTWACEGWDNKIYFGTTEPGPSGLGGTFRFDPSNLTIHRLYDGMRFDHNRYEVTAGDSDDLPMTSSGNAIEWHPGFLNGGNHNVHAFPRNPGTASTPPKSSWHQPGFPPLTVP